MYSRSFSIKAPFNRSFTIQVPLVEKVNGVVVKTYVDSPHTFKANVRTFGGTERIVNDVIVLEDTATLQTWYNRQIKADVRLLDNHDQSTYEVLGTPENILQQNQYMEIKVRRVRGGA